MPVCTKEKKLHLDVHTGCIAKLTHRERNRSTPHPCTTAPSTRHSRGSASAVHSAGSSPASPSWPTHPGERLLRIERCEVLIDLLLQSISCFSLLFTPQLSPCGSPLAGCLSSRGEALLSLSLPGDGISNPTRRWLDLQQARCDIVAVVYIPQDMRPLLASR